MTVGPNPFSREGSRPGDGLGETNRFETMADGSTPLAGGSTPLTGAGPVEPQPAPLPAAEPHPEPSGIAQPYPEPSGPGFPSYPYAEQPPPQLSPYPPQAGYGPLQPYHSGPAQYPVSYRAGYPYGPVLQNSPYASVALVTGIIGTFCGITGPLAVGFAVAALRQINREPRIYGGRGLAVAGLVTGILGSIWLTYFIVVALLV